MNEALIWLLIWGIWLLIPILTDGLSSLYGIMIVLLRPRKASRELAPQDHITVSIVIPAYNEEHNIDQCLMSIKAQTYPHERIEVIVVDDGSTDATVDRILTHTTLQSGKTVQTVSFRIYSSHFGGNLHVLRRPRDGNTEHGKAVAVNEALKLVTGDLIIAIDSDVLLAPYAVEEAVKAFRDQPDMIAATGHLIIDPYLIPASESDDENIVDVFGLIRRARLNPSEQALTACQFLEYLTTFHLGRYSESITDTMFTIAGAASVFRREAFELVGQYQRRTVSEDADLTLALHRLPGKQIGYIPGMEVHLAPELRWAGLYSQRVRWQRGALEVAAAHQRIDSPAASNERSLFWRLALPLRLQVDHTLAMPRIVWSFLIFLLPIFGYEWSVVVDALLLLLVFYIVVNLGRVLTAYTVSTEPEKVLSRRYIGYVLVLPFYNLFLFWTRMSSILITLTKDAQWNAESTFLKQLEEGPWLRRLRLRFISFVMFFM